jgi:hypothetical protein
LKKELLNKIGEYLWIVFLVSLVGYCTYSGFKGSDESDKKWLPTEENIEKWEKKKKSVRRSVVFVPSRTEFAGEVDQAVVSCVRATAAMILFAPSRVELVSSKLSCP